MVLAVSTVFHIISIWALFFTQQPSKLSATFKGKEKAALKRLYTMQIKTVIIQQFVMKVKRFNSIKGKLVVNVAIPIHLTDYIIKDIKMLMRSISWNIRALQLTTWHERPVGSHVCCMSCRLQKQLCSHGPVLHRCSTSREKKQSPKWFLTYRKQLLWYIMHCCTANSLFSVKALSI